MKNKVKVFYARIFYDFWIDIIQDTYELHNWIPVYIVADPRFERKIREIMPKSIFHNRDKAIVGIPSEECANDIEFPAIDQKILQKLSYNQTLYLHMLDRFDPGHNFPYRERIYYYHKMLRYWLGIIRHFKPDIVVFPSVPHMGYDYIMYMICRVLKVPMCMFIEISLGKLITSKDYANHFPIMEKYNDIIRNGESISMPADLVQYLYNLTDDYEKATPYFMKKYAENNLRRKLLGVTKRQIKNSIYLLKNMLNIHNVFNIKQRVTDTKELNKAWNHLTYHKIHRKYKRIAIKSRKNAKEYYYEHMDEFKKSKNYIYIPLHYQPEETTCPLGDIYAHQYLFIEMLSKSIPSDWRLYIKEHLDQFNGSLTGARSRNRLDYEFILDIPNVSFIDPSISPFDLIDYAQAIATVTGTAGWEAVNRGVPAIIFGHPWYKGCEGVFYTPTFEECKEAINIIKNGYKPDYEKIKIFAYAANTISVHGALHPEAMKGLDIIYEENVKNITKELLRFYNYVKK